MNLMENTQIVAVYVSTQMNDLGVYYNPPFDCDEKEACQRYYESFIEPLRHLESKWNLVKKA